MATPTLTHHILHGALGDLFVDMRAGGRQAPRPAVVLVHGFKGFKDWGFWPPFAERLARAGFSAVSFNMSGSGVDAEGNAILGERFSHNTFSADLADIATVMDALAAGALGVVPPTSVGLVGHSRGGGMSILQAARDPRLNALVTWAATASTNRWGPQTRKRWRAEGFLNVTNARTGQVLPMYTDLLDDVEQHADALDIPRAAGSITVPWLIIHGRQDETVSFGDAEALLKASGRATTTLVAMDNTGHTFSAGHPWRSAPAAEAVFDRTVEFLAGALSAWR
ncbi:MAG TPA: alpha/beta fold hydrolase [Gemmatimonadales bacterium]|jgi:dienelactone hydrolase|nr:alpha/beta fold hydrolase [Gemmatimonadales bacterium]